MVKDLLFRGAYYNAPVTDYKEGKPKYALEKGKYIVTGHNLERVYDPALYYIVSKNVERPERPYQIFIRNGVK